MDTSHGNSHIQTYGESEAADIALCSEISSILNKHYENHPWLIGCDHEHGVFHIKLLYPDKIGRITHHGIMLHIGKNSNHDTLKRKVMLAGGELLERKQMPTNAANAYSYERAKETKLILDGMI